MKILQFLRETYNGSEYLVEDKSMLKVMKVLKPEAIGGSKAKLANFISMISKVKHPGLLIPESFDLRDKPVIYLPYFKAKPVDQANLQSKDFAIFVLSLLREFLHRSIAIPVLSLDDFIFSESFYMIPPIWFNSKELPKGEKIVVAPEFEKYGTASIFSTAYTFGKLAQKFAKEAELKEFFNDFVYEDPTNRKTHLSLLPQIFSETIEKKVIKVKPVFMKRNEADQILQQILNAKSGLQTILVYGPQRSGKTTLLDYVSTEVRKFNIPVIWVENFDTLFLATLQLLSSEDYESLDQIDRKVIEEFLAGKRLSVDQISLTLGRILNKISKSVIVIDDVQEMGVSLRSLIEQLNSFNFKTSHILLLASTQMPIPVKYDYFIQLEPFDIHKTQLFLSSMLDVPGEQIETLSNWVYTISQGLPGKIVQVVDIAIKIGALKYENEQLQFDPSAILAHDFSEIVELKLDLEKYKKDGSNLIALCGEKFTVEDLEALFTSMEDQGIKVKPTLSSLLTDGIVYWENNGYRFTLKEIWEKLYQSIDEKTRERNHLILSQKFVDPAKKAWHMLMIGRKAAAACLFLLAARKKLNSYGELSDALNYLKEAEKIFPARQSYALISLKLKALLIKGEPNLLESFALMLEGNQKYLFEQYVALVAANKINLAREIEEKNPHIFEASTDYSKLRKLYWKVRRILASGEEVSKELMKELDILIGRLKMNKVHLKLKIQTLLLIAEIRRESHPLQVMEMLNSIRKISEENNFLDILPRILFSIASIMTTSFEAISLYEKVIEIGHKIGSTELIQTALSNLVWVSLYHGEVEKMFANLQRLRQLAHLTGMLNVEAYSYFVEGNYHSYNHEVENALEDFSREIEIEKYLGIEQRGLRGLVAAYAISGYIEEAVRLIKENIDNPAMKNPAFVRFRNLFLANDDQEFYKAWKEFLYKGDPYWKEETCQIFGPRLIKVDREGFTRFLEQLEQDNIRYGSYLSLAQVYEGAALAYQSIGEIPLAINYAERAISIYKSRGFENAAKWLENKLKFAPPIHQVLSIVESARQKANEEVSNLLSDAKNLIGQIIEYQNFAEYALDTLKIVSAQDQLSTTMEFLASRLMSLLPISSVALVLRNPKGKIVEKISINLSEVPLKPKFSYTPLEVCNVVSVYENYSLVLYVANKALYLDETIFTEFLRMLIRMQEIIAHVVKNILIYQESITDPLTGLYNRRYFAMKLKEEYERVNRYGGNFCVIVTDIDDFKKINDKYGHDVGDEVLRFISSVLRSSTRSTDVLSRYGGEEFVLILLNTTKNDGVKVAEKILKSIIDTNPFEFKLTLSFGVSGYPEDPAKRPEDLIVFADKAMYISKERGKACVTAYQ
ncbi:diguanylate cyclase [Pseudothermotoga thermarum]|uniref:Diguanylate cyclase n=1 Tax=Pseudothermotoga thermarum DSM 5069 TaxID=688269 RepID=F7YYI7_9THEM|nr:diguanylate cyclase [Pseudothermotoga thermarum]AEH51016.1 diguanylate cyclase [Pseudothermotoga thermarum DSM 5069]